MDWLVDELGQAAIAPTWLSPDGCRLYFDVLLDGNDVDLAERGP